MADANETRAEAEPGGVPPEAQPDGVPSDLVSCRQCREPIRKGARICRECKSYQDWRGYLSVSTTVLALLIALISVATSAAPVVYHWLGMDRSRLIVRSPIQVWDKLQLTVTNRGEYTANLETAYLNIHLMRGEKPVGIHALLVGSTDTSLPAGNRVLSFRFPLGNLNKDRAMNELKIPEGLRSVDFNVRIINSDGRVEDHNFPLRYKDWARIEVQHARLCEESKLPADECGDPTKPWQGGGIDTDM
jgi:hypothetical protein